MSLVALDTGESISLPPSLPKEMLSWVKNDKGQYHFRINFSSLSIMQECWRKVEYALIRNLDGTLEPAATIFGSAIHKGLECFYLGKRTERLLPPEYRETLKMIACGHWEPAWAEILVFRAAHAFVVKAEPLRALPDDNKRSISNGVYLLGNYFEHYVTDEYVVVSDDKGPIVERGFTMRLLEDSRVIIDAFGTIDAVLQSEVTGQILPCDHKTTSSLYGFYDMANPNFQYTMYLWAARKVLGFDTDSFLINALEVKLQPKKTGKPPVFARQITSRTAEDFQALLDAITLNCYTFAANLDAETWPMSTGACINKYGTCKFHQVCAAPPQLRENVIAAKFQERK